jgi:Zn-dependent M28 family amino/carboxypeptidase
MNIPLLSLLVVAPVGLAQAGTCSAQEVKQLVATISADSMMGRAPGSRGDSLTTAYLARVLESASGLAGAVTTQSVPLDSDGATSRNIIATIPGGRDEWVVLAAHHDGLGVGRPDARGDSIYNGANDNAVGVALAICVARGLPRTVGGRGVIVLLTAAEEEDAWDHVTGPSTRPSTLTR